MTLDLLNMAPKTQATKEKIHKLDFIKIKNVSGLPYWHSG